ncbi:MAG: sulfotransferase domain-containing protein [Candidatus Hodarchaeota archaeon]
MKLDFLIIGAEKSGTTFMHTILSMHPQIQLPSREINFFLTPNYQNFESTDLDNLFSNMNNESIKGIRNPLYLSLPECPLRIYKHYPNSKLIIFLRDPISRAISAYFHYMRFNLLPLLPLEEGFKKILNNEFNHTCFQKIAQGVIDFGFYYRHIQRYLEYFDKGNIQIFLNEDIKKDLNGVYRNICKFLDIAEINPPKVNFIKSRIIRFKSLQGIYSLRRLNLYRKYITKVYNVKLEEKNWPFRSQIFFKDNKVSKILYYSYNLGDQIVLNRLFNNSKPILNPILTEELHNIYKDDIDLLERFLKRPLDRWHIN